MVRGVMTDLSSQSGAAAAAARHIRVVLVDDSARCRSALAGFLGSHSHIRIAGQANNGPQGFALAAWLQPDFVITDLRMPGLDGLQLVQLLRREYPGIRSIITSAHDGPALRAECRRHGADAFITKQRLPEELPPLLTRLFAPAREPRILTCQE